jgi:phosphate-selective porin OprO and OprP
LKNISLLSRCLRGLCPGLLPLLLAATTGAVSATTTPPPTNLGFGDWSWGARLQIDAAHVDGVYTAAGDGDTVAYLRRAELGLDWRGPQGWRAALALESDGDGGLVVGEAVLAWRLRESGDQGLELRLGRFDPDFGLDPSTSSSWTVAMERSAIFDLAPDAASGDDSLGLRADHWGRHHTASLGAYVGEIRDQLVTRAVAFAPAGGALWQAGASLALGRGLDDNGRLRTRLGMRAATEADTGRRSTLAGALAAGDAYRSDISGGLEAAVQWGPWLLQAEWLQRRLDGAAAPVRSASGQTLLVAWALYGAPRRHEARRGRFGRPGSEAGRWGHLEAFARIDRLGVKGGRDAEVLTLGLAWTARDTWRAAINWVEGRSDDENDRGQTRGRGLALRVQAMF